MHFTKRYTEHNLHLVHILYIFVNFFKCTLTEPNLLKIGHFSKRVNITCNIEIRTDVSFYKKATIFPEKDFR